MAVKLLRRNLPVRLRPNLVGVDLATAHTPFLTKPATGKAVGCGHRLVGVGASRGKRDWHARARPIGRGFGLPGATRLYILLVRQ
jgi:hypothetical protein